MAILFVTLFVTGLSAHTTGGSTATAVTLSARGGATQVYHINLLKGWREAPLPPLTVSHSCVLPSAWLHLVEPFVTHLVTVRS